MVDINASLWLQMVNFLLLIFILNYLLYKPLLGIIEKRKKQLEEADEEVRRLQEAVEQKVTEYEQKLAQAKAEAMNKRAELLKEAAENAKRIIDEQRAKVPFMMAEFQKRIAQEMEEARRILANQARVISQEIVQKLLGRSVS